MKQQLRIRLRRSKRSMGRFELATVAALAVLAAAVLLTACGPASATLPGDAATPGANGHYKVGQPGAIGTYIITVKKVIYPKTLPGAAPKPGMKFMVVDMTIQTTDTNNDRLSAAAQLVVKDAKGTSYPLDADVTPTTDLTTTQLPDVIPALGTIHGEVAYEIPADAQNLQLVFNPSFLSSLIGHGKELTIDLQ